MAKSPKRAGHPAGIAAAEERRARQREDRRRRNVVLRAAERNPRIAEALKRARERPS